jgi:hypothetical protein
MAFSRRGQIQMAHGLYKQILTCGNVRFLPERELSHPLPFPLL